MDIGGFRMEYTQNQDVTPLIADRPIYATDKLQYFLIVSK